MDAIDACRHPLRLEPIAVPRVWGGDRILKEIHPGLAAAPPIGESWEVSGVGEDPALHSRIASGAARGTTLRVLRREAPRALLGAAFAPGGAGEAELPLLYKYIDARETLSVQVHPSDELLARQGLPGTGKDEAWVILDAAPGATIIYGLDAGLAYEDYLERARAGNGGEGLRRVAVRRGDFILLPAGTVHAIGAGILLAELQQSSDITYRIHDWGRVGLDGKPRALHIEQAALVRPPRPLPPCPLARPARKATLARRVDCDSFTIDEITLARGELALARPADRFGILSVLSGQGSVRAADGERISVALGDVIFVPAAAPRLVLEATNSLWCLWMLPGNGARVAR